ncbi:MAG: hypothetical protein R6W88_01480, partial [Desulfobacterales bacterium]
LQKNRLKNIKIRFWNMLGFLPYLFYEKILKRELNTELRNRKNKRTFSKLISFSLKLWFKYIENKFNFGFGLSIIAVANKN